MTNDEIRMTKQMPAKSEWVVQPGICFVIRAWSFVIDSDFGLRHSDFALLLSLGCFAMAPATL
jgi:hypothetical protein